MTIKRLIKDAEQNFNKWNSISMRGSHQQHNKTEIQTIALREYFAGRLDGLTDAKRAIKEEEAA